MRKICGIGGWYRGVVGWGTGESHLAVLRDVVGRGECMWARAATDSGCWHSHLRGAEASVVVERQGKSAGSVAGIAG